MSTALCAAFSVVSSTPSLLTSTLGSLNPSSILGGGSEMHPTRARLRDSPPPPPAARKKRSPMTETPITGHARITTGTSSPNVGQNARMATNYERAFDDKPEVYAAWGHLLAAVRDRM